MPSRCATCRKEAPCVSVAGLDDAGWTMDAGGWRCKECRAGGTLESWKEVAMKLRLGLALVLGARTLQEAIETAREGLESATLPGGQ